ncbi:MAG: Hsp20/alpha crystallin family protein [Calditrichaeota bacterium]|nr:Hsp20/alpha crystallin family protein [Calditrichota bacterium]
MHSDILSARERANVDNNHSPDLIKIKPVVDIYETEQDIVIHAEMPKVNKEDLRVYIKNGILTISGKRQNNNIDGEWLLKESRDVMYHRQFELEDNLDHESVRASYQAGILKVSVAKKDAEKPRKIEIN